MALIIRCPSCGALWRVSQLPGERLRCSACRHDFEPGDARTAELSDEALDRELARKAEAAAQARHEAQKAQAAAEPKVLRQAPLFATDRARELNAPSEEHAPMPQFDEKDAGSGAPMPAIYRTKKSGISTFFLFIGIVIVAAFASAAACLLMHDFVLAQAPYLRPVYEKVCGQLPCPGFVWNDARAFRAEASLSPDPNLGMIRPVAVIRLTNASEHPQLLPVLELKYLDPAGDVLAQRVLDPSDYGYPQQPAVLPAGESLETRLTLKDPLEFAAASAAAAPVTDSMR